MLQFTRRRNNRTVLGAALLCAVVSVCARAAGPEALPVTLDQKQAQHRALFIAKPEYPPIAKVNYLQGRVRLQVTVNDRGKVVQAHVLEGEALLAAAALQAVRHWTYRPLFTVAGPTGFSTFVKLKYSLNSNAPELSPQEAEKDFIRQVKPPQVLQPRPTRNFGNLVQVRLLLDDRGEIADVEAALIDSAGLEAVRQILRTWTFRPAYWGNLPVASYLDIAVPVNPPALAATQRRLH
jgi:TonB family protein